MEQPVKMLTQAKWFVVKCAYLIGYGRTENESRVVDWHACLRDRYVVTVQISQNFIHDLDHSIRIAIICHFGIC